MFDMCMSSRYIKFSPNCIQEWKKTQMRAIVDINGKQYEVEEGRYVQVDFNGADENGEVVLDNVRLVIAGEQSVIGAPFIEGAVVKTQVKRHGRGPKILVYKMRCKKGYRRKNGHRQDFTELNVISIDFPGKENIKIEKKEEPAQAPAKAPKTEKPKKAAKAKTAEAPVEEKPKTKPAQAETAEAAPAEAPEKESKKAAAPAAETATEQLTAQAAEAPKAEEAPAAAEAPTEEPAAQQPAETEEKQPE